jgi:hypothetical protein
MSSGGIHGTGQILPTADQHLQPTEISTHMLVRIRHSAHSKIIIRLGPRIGFQSIDMLEIHNNRLPNILNLNSTTEPLNRLVLELRGGHLVKNVVPNFCVLDWSQISSLWAQVSVIGIFIISEVCRYRIEKRFEGTQE